LFVIPEKIFIEITRECNLHCAMCKMWTLKDLPHALKTEKKIDIVNQLGSWYAELRKNNDRIIPPTIVFTGGETFLKRDEILKLSKLSRLWGINTAINTNGTLIENFASEIIINGPDYLVISIDSHNPKIHDAMRGVNGTFRKAINSLKALSIAKQKFPDSPVKLMINIIASKQNQGRLRELLGVVRENGDLDGRNRNK